MKLISGEEEDWRITFILDDDQMNKREREGETTKICLKVYLKTDEN